MDKYQLVQCISAGEVDRQVRRLAAQINIDYGEKDLIVIGILKGSFIFLADLIRHLTVPLEVDFIRLTSYGKESESCGQVQITKDIESPIRGRDVLVVEDIVDTGLTIRYLCDHLAAQQPESLKVCTLIDKYERRLVEFNVDYVGLRLAKGFVVGYGLDYSEKHRNLPGIYEVEFVNE